VPVKRMVFHEITPQAIREAVNNWRELDRRLVDAQETRRILDRLYGYEVSPVLWRKVLPRLSAGRVQSVATRLVVERERARMRFRSAGYWDIAGRFSPVVECPDGLRPTFGALLVSLDGNRVATGRDFKEDGEVSRADVVVLDEASARGLAGRLADAAFSVRSVEEKPWRRSPYPPFMTSTLQQEAGRQLRFSATRTMRVAQELYDGGYITYMRTDSTSLSDEALHAARGAALELFGREYVPAQPRRYDKRVKNAQEAHEAVRPAGEHFRHPERSGLRGDQLRLYELVWKRTVACQMADAQGLSVQVRLGATSATGEEVEFAASGRVISFPGFLRAYVEGSDDPEAELEDREVRLPRLAQDDPLVIEELRPEGHTTQPPARYSEASLVKALEEMGVGRPSTYASIIDTIQGRGYVWKKGSALVPSWTAFAVVGLLEQHFAKLVDYGFTAEMEEDLDSIARGDEEPLPWLTRFYFGSSKSDEDGSGLKQMVAERLAVIDAREVNSVPIGGEGSGVVVRVGRYGPYVQRGDKRASVPEGMAPDELTLDKARELLDAPPPERADKELGADPESGLQVLVRSGRFGPYVQLGRAEAMTAKPRTSSLLPGMSPEDITLEDALRLLSLPRVVGRDPATKEDVVVDNGRYGPYVRRAKDYRSLQNPEQLFTLTLDEALAILSQPRQRRSQQASAPLAELGTDPVSAAPVVVKEGRFGPYVTDGIVNASLRRGDTVESLTLERAAELLAERRARVEADAASGVSARRRGRIARADNSSQAKEPPARKAASPARAAKKAASPARAAKKAASPARAAKKAASPARAAKKAASPAPRLA